MSCDLCMRVHTCKESHVTCVCALLQGMSCDLCVCACIPQGMSFDLCMCIAAMKVMWFVCAYLQCHVICAFARSSQTIAKHVPPTGHNHLYW